jgi:uncharacterized protein YbbC (DUF1343 family)
LADDSRRVIIGGMTHRFVRRVAAASFLLLATALAPAQVLTGIDVLEKNSFDVLKGRKVGIITNHTGVDSRGRRTIDVLKSAPGVTVVAIFSPEHGLYGKKDEKNIGDDVDPASGLKVLSLYGKARRPTTQMVQEIDTLVYDIQDVGARFYTYISTLGLCMEAAREYGLKFVVLDRPNPITGLRVEGPVADPKHTGTFTAYAPIPIAHGMTVGEMARYYNKEKGINADLVVVPVEGWKRSMYYDQTGLKWISPSPNMRTLDAAILYPGWCLMERPNTSVGRGTDLPFEVLGAPWVDGRKLAAALNDLHLPGVEFAAVRFTPTKGAKLGGQKCEGVRAFVTDRSKVEAVKTGVAIAYTLEKLFPKDFQYEKVVGLLANQEASDAILKLNDPHQCDPIWQDQVRAFENVRKNYLMYE